ncbi:AAA domain-containing protein [Micromonospora lupini]|uniref:AAA domain-containing protein n=1 Tax=Micromonospora lupini TaxID=285679 RepID=UPI002259C082|nr:AAA domain-containing protein [Micromonospora lupini]MCX5066043.1 AAA domain-containing protein [Micromonospora lupini]
MTLSQDAIGKTTKLIDFLADVTAAVERDPVCDILEDLDLPDLLVWLDALPQGVQWVASPADDVIIRLRPARAPAEPAPPELLHEWLDMKSMRKAGGPAPRLLSAPPQDEDGRAGPPGRIVRAFDAWSEQWQAWSDETQRVHAVRRLYEQLERAAKLLEQQNDEYELILGIGLLRWTAPDGTRFRRHLATEGVVARLDRATAEVSVSMGTGRRRTEDRELLGDQELFRSERGRPHRQAIVDGNRPWLELLRPIVELLEECLDTDVQTEAPPIVMEDELPSAPTVSLSPALVVRRRSRVLLTEAYQHIGQALRQPDTQVPVALAQLVVDTEPEHRNQWLKHQGAASGDVLGSDPLFPLPTNDEQMHVIELLRSETGVVVQGPPGTGKTHTIANLVSALLARGQRVLVTSQKDQALRELRAKVPASLRDLCVLMTDGRNAAIEVGSGLDALSDLTAGTDNETLSKLVEVLRGERHELRSRSAGLNQRIRQLREIEFIAHDPVAPWFSTELYRGSLGQIARQVKSNAGRCDWIPAAVPDPPDTPPLTAADAVELVRLIRSTNPLRNARLTQTIPDLAELPSPAALAEAFTAELDAASAVEEYTTVWAPRLAAAGEGLLNNLDLLGQRLTALIDRLGVDPDTASPSWVTRAIGDHFVGRRQSLWRHLAEVAGRADRLQAKLRTHALGAEVRFTKFGELDLGQARHMLTVGRDLRTHLQSLTCRTLLTVPPARIRAAALINGIRVDGRPPTTVPLLDAALDHLEVHIETTQLLRLWADVGVAIKAGSITTALAELQDSYRLLAQVQEISAVHTTIRDHMEAAGLPARMSTTDDVIKVTSSTTAARHHIRLEAAQQTIVGHRDVVRQHLTYDNPCPEVELLITAVDERSLDRYRRGLVALNTARQERHAEQRRLRLTHLLHSTHPQLLHLLQDSIHDPQWEDRMRDLPAAWAWQHANRFVRGQRTAEAEQQVRREYDGVETHLAEVTAQLAAAEATLAFVNRTTDADMRAIRAFRGFRKQIGAGTGRKVRELRQAAQAAMDQAQGIVPAWVVPLPSLLEHLTITRHAFDVIIVDEASQVGVEHLFLLWLAPRIIVVGDDQQCTPAPNRMGKSFDEQFQALQEHLGDLPAEIRYHFTSKSHLYGLLSARSGKDAVVRLREHFRCMPEIINWSKDQFYRGASEIIPLRERTADDLEPLRVVQVDGAYLDGTAQAVRNPVEAKRIVSQLLDCLNNPKYAGKTFGIIVLHGQGQIKLLDHEINAAIAPEVRAARQISVGSAPNFQGAERHIIFLSTVVTAAPRRISQYLYQNYNVAVSRAQDQLWLFTSVAPHDFKPDDLRSSLVNYMLNPPSVYGVSPELKSVSADRQSPPFESLLEQRVYRILKRRGYHVVPQFKVGSRTLDLVVVGSGGRLAVECDGHRWHTRPTDVTADGRRDRELSRMRWEVIRIRESEFELDPDKELAPLFTRLAEHRISPRRAQDVTTEAWTPIELPSDNEEELNR